MGSEKFAPIFKLKIKQLDQTMVTNIIQEGSRKTFENVSKWCLFFLLTSLCYLHLMLFLIKAEPESSHASLLHC